MSTSTIVFIVIIVVLVAALVALYFFGKKAQRRQAVQQEQMAAIAQTISMLVIDKKKLKISQSGLPAQVIEQTPRWLRWNKLPIVKAKVGPKIMTLACDANVFEVLPVKKEVKVVVSGIYITEVKSARGGLEVPVKKKGFFKRILGKKDKKAQQNGALQNYIYFAALLFRAVQREEPCLWHTAAISIIISMFSR